MALGGMKTSLFGRPDRRATPPHHTRQPHLRQAPEVNRRTERRDALTTRFIPARGRVTMRGLRGSLTMREPDS